MKRNEMECKVVHARYVPFQLAEVLVARSLFYEILERINIYEIVRKTGHGMDFS